MKQSAEFLRKVREVLPVPRMDPVPDRLEVAVKLTRRQQAALRALSCVLDVRAEVLGRLMLQAMLRELEETLIFRTGNQRAERAPTEKESGSTQ